MFEHKLILQIPGSFAAMLLFPAVVPTPHLTHQSSCFGWNLALVPMASVAPTPLIFSRSFENKGRFDGLDGLKVFSNLKDSMFLSQSESQAVPCNFSFVNPLKT